MDYDFFYFDIYVMKNKNKFKLQEGL